MINFGKKVLILTLAFLFLVGGMSLAQDLPREETLVVSGAMWGPPSTWNILIPNPTPGTGGLVYETMFSYNPLENEYEPWLAESGEWVSDNEYVLNVREGINWTDGEEFNAEDVVFTYQLAKDNEIPYSPIWDWMESVEAEDNFTVRFTFSEPHYAEWDAELYQRYIIPEHIWSEIPSDELITRTMNDPVGTGPYTHRQAAQDRMVWERNDDWWGNDVFGQPKPKYLVDLVNQSNNVVMGMLMKGELDLSNNFLPGIQRIKDQFGLVTWYEEEPYMLSWNTAVMYMNTLREPMGDTQFRRAMAFMVNQDTIVDRVYGGLVQSANPTGLFGEGWQAYLDEEIVEESGFEYNPTKAKALLNDAGYVDANDDGWREMPNGDPLELEIMVPSGWTDWMESVRVIASNAEEIGVNIAPSFPDSSLFDNKRFNSDFDLMIGNFQTTLSSTPFDYWFGVANRSIHGETISNGNWGAYDNPELFEKIDEFNMTNDEARKQELASDIQETLLQDMPSVPLWHNGLWAQATTEYWTNWPDEDNPYGVPVSWGNAYQLGMIDTLIGIEPVE
ncbi:peptide/nickel transport system substrate-binding protein [Halanaerobium saccharolyticum]|uniref:Peptide/nickel transport system substrate-binding protein n=1 Tax=Halanaerobium saccharolyticum TaxID=43595 RepID=A0A4R7Z180_9FIRM|nr:ABC transporter substrate-binding protein [Halanaerobium saccharolyticum]RAK07875.1 peptide/nickel transport system substrate-binding protein [Halanaerobium saccharolyticum]TDW04489.1 peptide/nickel transport system substrate-binding protein [Halanaerobium saccharolyticum]TDX59825.1 peptide/nickel transport system substrate-binding protein [Halanaerobium saccharolyticum]